MLKKFRRLSVGDFSLVLMILFLFLDLCLNFIIVDHLILNILELTFLKDFLVKKPSCNHLFLRSSSASVPASTKTAYWRHVS